MKSIKLKKMDEQIYYHKLKNGLEIYLYTKDTINNNYVTFTTKFGSIYNEFIPIEKNKMEKVPHGVAHFLEHKVFAQKEGPQPEEFFAQSGALCNAYTTFKNTTYLFSCVSNLKENINYLLDYVQSPYFTKENVKSEKGIITQEIHMCDDNPQDILYEHIRKNTFNQNPFKDSIIGTVEDIEEITEETLYTCYNTFYHPQNMFLVVTGNFNPNEIIRTIEENQSKKEFPKFTGIKIKTITEKDKVSIKEEIIEHNTNISKIAYNIKISLKNINMSIRKYNIYLFIIFSLLFDESSSFDEKIKKEKIITNSLYINILNCDTHTLVSLVNETNNYNQLLERIKKELKNINISKEDFERKKKVLISNEIFSFENIEIINEMIIDNIIYDNHIENNMIGLLHSLTKEELDNIISNLNLSNNSIVILKAKN
ncbi:MAG: pitrilysin family protein [Bacilli bacterium]|nr:pitrilysin family protein [Bacilli bacterium]